MVSRRETDLHQLLDQARQDSDVLALIRFGSVARGDDHAESDVDVCLVLPPRRNGLSADQLAQIRMRYLVYNFDIHLFQALPLYVRRRVLKEGQVLYAADESALYEVALRTARQYEDFQHLYHEYLDQVAHA